MKLITDEVLLRKPCSPISVNKGLALGRKMHSFLLNHNKSSRVKGVGLAAPQIGEYKQVCILQVDGLQLTLINPKIVDHCIIQVPFKEGCLSLPGIEVETYRWPWIVVQSDNISKIELGIRKAGGTLLQSIVAQHEIDHLSSILITDRTKNLSQSYEGFRL